MRSGKSARVILKEKERAEAAAAANAATAAAITTTPNMCAEVPKCHIEPRRWVPEAQAKRTEGEPRETRLEPGAKYE